MGLFRRAQRRLRAVRNAGSDGRKLLVEAFALTCATRLALWVFPYAVARRAVNRATCVVPRRARSPERVAWAVAAAGDRVPGATCLVRALVGEALLSWTGRSALRFGVRRVSSGVEAHAWLEFDGQVLIGRDERFVLLEQVSS